MLPERLIKKYSANANTKNIVFCGSYRFTVLTEALIRIEYDPEENFEDRATQCVICRDLGKIEFEKTSSEDLLIIETSDLMLRFVPSQGLTAEGLTIQVRSLNGTPVWHYGDSPETLKGTYRTLDGIFVERSVTLSEGVCSRDGFALLDDSKSLLMTDDGWVEPRKEGTVDLYFFGYGHSYVEAVKALYRLTGNPPLLPSYVFGNWWSRYHAYSEESYMALISRFKEEDIPFSVSVIDMDWHWSNGSTGKSHIDEWTGYSWNTKLFPDYKRFLKRLHEEGLHSALNLHPARGVQEHENMYEEMAKIMGVDPESKEPVRFQPENPDFWDPYFKLLHHPYEKDGVDFWWMDWQQGTESAIPGLDPLWILNYMHSLDCQKSEKRPMYFSRYAGPGSQRFFIGFSGDTYINWDAYRFEPYFTATAANIAFPYWSHDIGGFQHGIRDEELYMRWVQFGVFSPILRIHSTNYDFVCKEPWNYGIHTHLAVSEMLRLRHMLFPYIYTMNYRVYKDNVALCQPIYHYYPEEESAYKFKNEYFFGSEMIVAPATEKTDKITKLTATELWLPNGIWIDFFNGLVYNGGREFKVYRDLDSFPVFCKAGGIVPMNSHIKGDNTVGSKTDMEIQVFAGASNSFMLYEDEGDNNRYLDGYYATTEMSLNWEAFRAEFVIHSARGETSVIPSIRNYTVRLRGFNNKAEITVKVSGRETAVTAVYEEESNTLAVALKGISVTEEICIILQSEEPLLSKNRHWKKLCFKRMLAAETLSGRKHQLFNDITNNSLSFEKRKELMQCYNDLEPEFLDAVSEIFELSNFCG